MESQTVANDDAIATEAPPLRRSVRRIAKLAAESRPEPQPAKTMSEPRRNPKRKASEAANHIHHLPDNLLEEALKPLTTKDIEEWEGWIELESEPAFFNIILRDLGVKNVKAQEIFTIDQDSLALLPKPVFGLIFLFQYVPDHETIEQEGDASEVWFANQTTENACATVALLNIVMNADEIDLGDKLADFKESTKGLCTALRGHQLSNNTFIRTIHNSFTRRMDHLNADLCLENDISDAQTKKPKKRAMPKKGPKATKQAVKKVSGDYGFHFIAYVPAGGCVWELDGLRNKPHRLDVVTTDDWTEVARPQIEARMLQYEESQLSFNLLALCQTPLATHAVTLAQSVAALQYLRDRMCKDAAFTDLLFAVPVPLDVENDAQLSELQLKKCDLESAPLPDSLKEKLSQPHSDTNNVYELHQQLIIEVKAALGAYRAELAAIADDERRVKGRKKEYGPALHRWVSKLAEKGVLEELIKST